MKYPYAVKANGEYYKPNDEIPEEKPVKAVETTPEKPKGRKKEA